MALRNNTTTTAETNKFETEEDTSATAQVQDTAEANTDAAPEVAAATTAVATQGTRALANPGAKALVTQNVLSDKKDAFHVEFDSTPRLAAEQGSFVIKFDGTETDIGAECSIEMMSYQDSWVVSPNDKKADVELVKYSDDGVTSKDGVDLKQHLQDLIELGYSKAKIAHRCVVVGELVSTAKGGEDFIEKLVQIDLPESGRRSFNAYTLQASWAVGKGRKTAAEASVLKLKAVKDKTKSGEVYTKVSFS